MLTERCFLIATPLLGRRAVTLRQKIGEFMEQADVDMTGSHHIRKVEIQLSNEFYPFGTRQVAKEKASLRKSTPPPSRIG
jgi:hypothetical protein